MKRITDRTELLNCFRPIDREVVFIDEEVKFPLAIKPYFTWQEPNGFRSYILYEAPNSPDVLGAVFERSRGS